MNTFAYSNALPHKYNSIVCIIFICTLFVPGSTSSSNYYKRESYRDREREFTSREYRDSRGKPYLLAAFLLFHPNCCSRAIYIYIYICF